ncbi:hypothetical protein O9X98_06380 [Agrobacterium salinitolerans]|nr:hypothetical protein [Agrobacterium salinitolerans]
MSSANEDVFAEELTVRIKPLAWVENSGPDYRLFEADTEFGRFVYGTDRQSVSYHQSPKYEFDHPTEEEARKAAEQSYGRLALEKIHALTVSGVGAGREPLTFSVVGELISILLKYAEDCVEARSYGGPTIYPRRPFDEGLARKYAIQLKELERQLDARA